MRTINCPHPKHDEPLAAQMGPVSSCLDGISERVVISTFHVHVTLVGILFVFLFGINNVYFLITKSGAISLSGQVVSS